MVGFDRQVGTAGAAAVEAENFQLLFHDQMCLDRRVDVVDNSAEVAADGSKVYPGPDWKTPA